MKVGGARLLVTLAKSKERHPDILWPLLLARKETERLCSHQETLLANSRGRQGLGIKGVVPETDVARLVNERIGQIDAAYQQAWIEFATEMQRRRDGEEEYMRQQFLQMEKNHANRWIAAVESLTNVAGKDVEIVGFRAIKEALFQGVKLIEKGDESLQATEQAIAYLKQAREIHDEYSTSLGVYQGLFNKFGSALNLMTPEEFMAKYPSIDDSII